jgi:hypothetical protein
MIDLYILLFTVIAIAICLIVGLVIDVVRVYGAIKRREQETKPSILYDMVRWEE